MADPKHRYEDLEWKLPYDLLAQRMNDVLAGDPPRLKLTPWGVAPSRPGQPSLESTLQTLAKERPQPGETALIDLATLGGFDARRAKFSPEEAYEYIQQLTTRILDTKLQRPNLFSVQPQRRGWADPEAYHKRQQAERQSLFEYIRDNILNPRLEQSTGIFGGKVASFSERQLQVLNLVKQENKLLQAFPGRPFLGNRVAAIAQAMAAEGLIDNDTYQAMLAGASTDSALEQRGGDIYRGIIANLDPILQASIADHGARGLQPGPYAEQPVLIGNLVQTVSRLVTGENTETIESGESLFQFAYGDPAEIRTEKQWRAGVSALTEKNTLAQAVKDILQASGVNISTNALEAMDDQELAAAYKKAGAALIASTETLRATTLKNNPSLVGTDQLNEILSRHIAAKIGPDGGRFQESVLQEVFAQAEQDAFEREAKARQEAIDDAAKARQKAIDDAKKQRDLERTDSGMTTVAKNILASFGFTEGDVTERVFQQIRNSVRDHGQELTRLALATTTPDPDALPGDTRLDIRLIDTLVQGKEDADIAAEAKKAADMAGSLPGAEKIVEQWLADNGIRRKDILEEDFNTLVNQVMATEGTAALDTITKAQVEGLVQRRVATEASTEAREAFKAGTTIGGSREVVTQILFDNQIRIGEIPEERLRQLDQMVANLGEDVVRHVLTKDFLQQFVAEQFNIDALANLTPESLQAALVRAGAIPQNIPPGFAQHVQRRIIPALIATVVENVRQNLGRPLDLVEVVRGFVTGEQPAPEATSAAALARGEAVGIPDQPGVESGIGALFQDLNAPVDDPLREVASQFGTPTGPAPSEIPKFTDFGLLPTAFDPARFDQSRPPSFGSLTAGRVVFPDVPQFSEQQVSDERLAQIRQLQGLEPEFRDFVVGRFPLLQEEFTRSEKERVEGIRQQAREEATAFTKSGFIQPDQIQGFLDVAGQIQPRTLSAFTQAQFPALRREFEALPETVAARTRTREAEAARVEREAAMAESKQVLETAQAETERRRRLRRGGRRAIFV